MKVLGLNKREYHIKLNKKISQNKSSGHIRCRELLKQVFPFDQIYEEVSLPGSGKLTADFFIPMQQLIVEVHGRQHFEFCVHFHGNIQNFYRAKARDSKKQLWCEINGINYLALKDDEDDGEWRTKLSRI